MIITCYPLYYCLTNNLYVNISDTHDKKWNAAEYKKNVFTMDSQFLKVWCFKFFVTSNELPIPFANLSWNPPAALDILKF